MENLNKYIKAKIKELKDGNNTFKSLFEIIHNQGDRIFSEVKNGLITQELTYSEFKEYVYQLASYYNRVIKEDKNEFVGIYMENSINFVASIWAILMIGYKPLLMNSRLPLEINNSILNMLNIKVVVADVNVALKANIIINDAKNKLLNLETYEAYSLDSWADELALATTATTLNYKVCVYKGKDFVNQVLNAEAILNESKLIKKHYKHRLKQLMFLPLYHVFGLVACYFWFSVFGRTFVFLKNNSSDEIIHTIKEHEVTHIFSIPLFWNTIVKEINKEIGKLDEKKQRKVKKGINLSLKIQKIFPRLGKGIAKSMFKEIVNKTLGKSVLFCISGGGYINDETMRFINALGYPLFNGYGSTEQGITSVELRDNVKYRLFGLVGHAFESVEYKVENEKLYIRSNSSCSKIYYKDGKIEEINHDEWFDTSDSASLDKNYLKINGRCDDVILLENGEKINPDLIEKELILSSKRYSVLDLDGLCLILEIGIMSKEETERLQREVKQENAKYNFKHIYYTYNEIANANAIKVSRQNLKRMLSQNSIKLVEFSNISNINTYEKIDDETLNALIDIFSSILGKSLGKEDINKHFTLDLGGSSIDYCSLLIKIENYFNIELDDSINLSSISDFAKYISTNK